MKLHNSLMRSLGAFIALVVLILFVAPDFADARRGGGSRRSFGGSKRSTSRQQPKSSFGGKKSTQTRTPATAQRKAMPKTGGNALSSSKAYTSKYGTPRKTETRTMKDASGQTRQYRVNDYGGYGSGLMTGYMMGSVPFMWSMPFHPAFYYSKPYYATNPDGTVSVYPPTFNASKLIFTIIIAAVIIYIIYAIVRNARRKKRSSGETRSYSSFG